MTPDETDGYLRDAQAWIASQADFFDRRRRPVLVARAPGRLDVMGGIADYSGSLVLELPLAVATWVAVQVLDAPELIIESNAGRVKMPLEDIVPAAPLPYAEAHLRLTRDPARAWAAYVAGALVVLQHGTGITRARRPGAGAIGRADRERRQLVGGARRRGVRGAGGARRPRDGRTRAALAAQKVENFVVGAPCGMMDQMTAAAGRRGYLIELLCQPARARSGTWRFPHGGIFGIDSGIRHAVSGADYGTVRAAAFMGYRIIADTAGLAARAVGPGRVAIDDPTYGGYLANVPPADWRARFATPFPNA